MVHLRISEILKEQGKTEYWLYKRSGMTNYSSFKRLIHNESSRIRFETIAKICKALGVPVEELFESTNKPEEKT